MKRMIDRITKEEHDLEAIQAWGIAPLKALTTTIVESDFDQKSLLKIEVLTDMLHETVCDLDNRITG